MYDTKEDSESSLRQVTSGAKKFSDLYARSADRDKMELKNVTKQSVNPVVWGALKGTPAAACCKTAIEIETEDGNTRWAVLHIMNRKRIPLPSLKDPAVRRRCANAAQQQIAVTHVINLMLQHVETMSDQPAKVMLDMPTTKDILTYIISSPRL
jgi:hypothetical protein